MAGFFFKQHLLNFEENWILMCSLTGKNLVVISQSTFVQWHFNRFSLQINGPMWDNLYCMGLNLSHIGPLIWRENQLKCHYSKLLWDITTIFLPVKDHIRIQLFYKFKRCCMKNKPAMPLTFSNFSRARQAHFLSYDLQIWWKVITF